MKKSFVLSMIFVVALLLTFTSCKKENVVTPPTEEKEYVLRKVAFMGYHNERVEQTACYKIEIADKGMYDEKGTQLKEGTLITIWLAKEGATNPQFLPANGTYILANEVLSKYSKVSLLDANGKDVSMPKNFTEMEFIVSNGTFTIKATDDAETKYDLKFSGINNGVNDSDYALEIFEYQNINLQFTDNSRFRLLEAQPTYRFLVLISKPDANTGLIGVIRFVLEPTASTLPEGSYPVSDEITPGTMLESFGAEKNANGSYSLYASFVAKASGGNWQPPYYFITNGTAMVTSTDINFTGKSYFGSDIVFRYTGSMEPTN